jgi:GH25 family lysozyme M1 (1,4-beta-N-acetylmuramidase)
MGVTLADVSEYQPNIDLGGYLAAGYRVIIARAHSGFRPDHCWPARRDAIRRHPFAGAGYYQYVSAVRDPAQQAREFIQAVGPLAPNEWPIGDFEEGAGDQTRRAEAWFRVIDQWCGFPAMLYTGASFLHDRLSGAGHWRRPLWIASYPSSYQPTPTARPAGALLWQYTDRGHFPGIPGACDGNQYPNSYAQLVRACRPDQPKPPSEAQIMAIAAAVNSAGALHVFVEAKDGSVWYTWQSKGQSGWHGGKAGASVASLSPFAPAPKK